MESSGKNANDDAAKMENYFYVFHTSESGPRFPVLSVLVSPDKRASNRHPGLFLYFTLIDSLAGSCLTSAC